MSDTMTMQETNLMLQEELLKKEEECNDYKRKIFYLKKYIKENSTKLGKYTIFISENNELLEILEDED